MTTARTGEARLGKTYGQARAVALRLTSGQRVLCLSRRGELLRGLVTEMLEEGGADPGLIDNLEMMEMKRLG